MQRYFFIIISLIVSSSIARSAMVAITPDRYMPATRIGKLLYNRFCVTDTINAPAVSTSYSNQVHNYKADESPENNTPATLFVKVSTNKTECYVGESIFATYKLYSRVDSKSRITKQPRFEGFNVYDMFDMISIVESNETIRGSRYKVHTIRKAQLVPLQTGVLNLDPIELKNTVHYTNVDKELHGRSGQLNDMLNQFLEEEKEPVIEHLFTTKSQSLSITVKALPELNRPSNFKGAVGQFTISASITNEHHSTNKANILRVVLKGNGDWKLVEAPDIKWPVGIESMDVRSIEEPFKKGVPLASGKIFEYSFITKKPGEFIIPTINFSFFDPNTLMYQTIETSPILFKASVENTSMEMRQSRITGSSQKSVNLTTARYPYFYVIIIIMSGVIILGSILLIRKKRISSINKTTADSLVALDKHDDKVNVEPGTTSNDPLLKARQLVDNLHFKEYYIELHKTLWNLFGEKLQLSSSNLNKPVILDKLYVSGWNTEMINMVNVVLTECDRILYLPDYQTSVSLEDQMLKAEKIVAQLQSI